MGVASPKVGVVSKKFSARLAISFAVASFITHRLLITLFYYVEMVVSLQTVYSAVDVRTKKIKKSTGV